MKKIVVFIPMLLLMVFALSISSFAALPTKVIIQGGFYDYNTSQGKSFDNIELFDNSHGSYLILINDTPYLNEWVLSPDYVTSLSVKSTNAKYSHLKITYSTNFLDNVITFPIFQDSKTFIMSFTKTGSNYSINFDYSNGLEDMFYDVSNVYNMKLEFIDINYLEQDILDTWYNFGKEDGYMVGHEDGYMSGSESGYENGYNSGYYEYENNVAPDLIEASWLLGYKEMFWSIYENGLEGFDFAMQVKNEDSFIWGNGYSDGYDDGTEFEPLGFLKAIIYMLVWILTVEFLPGLSALTLIGAFLGLIIIFIVFKMMSGGD